MGASKDGRLEKLMELGCAATLEISLMNIGGIINF